MQLQLIFKKRNNKIYFHFYCKMYFSVQDKLYQPIIINMPVMSGIFNYIKSSAVTITNTASKGTSLIFRHYVVINIM